MKRLFLLLVFATLLPADAVYTLYVPQIADGGGWKTIFTIVNLSNKNEGLGTLRFHAEDGSALSLPVSGIPGGAASQIPIDLPPNGALVLETSGTRAVTTVGWAELNDQSVPSALALTAIYRARSNQIADYEASVLALPVASKPLVFSFDNTVAASGARFATGFGLINASSIFDATVAVAIRDESGQILASDTLTLKSLNHMAFSLGDRYPVTGGRRGTVLFTPDANIWLDVMALRFNPTGPFTSLVPLVQ